MNTQKIVRKIMCLAVVVAALLLGTSAKADTVNTSINFNVDPNYDSTGRQVVPATLIETTSSLYFYIETDFWNAQTQSQKNTILSNLGNLSGEFSNNIYPTLTSVYGSEWNPGIDHDSKITMLLESTNDNLGGYFRSDDEYSKLQIPDSNEREMVYLPISQVASPQLKVFLAHEFVHLITFNQKDRLQGVQEDVWLSEARSDYASTLLGYDNTYDGSNLQRRVQDFLEQPGDSLTEWQNTKYDYAVESMFFHYLVDHYGAGILANSLKSKLVGIASINEALAKSGAKENFSQIFTDWTIAIVINDCSIDTRYCYVNPNLTNLKINPSLIFLPLSGNSSLSMNNVAKNWSGNWQKIIGGNGNLTLNFSSVTGINFQVPYILYDKSNNYVVKFLSLTQSENGQIVIPNFGTDYNSLIIMPSLQTKMAGFLSSEPAYPYTFNIVINGNVPGQVLPPVNTPPAGCSAFNNNLYVGVVNKTDVTCLQQFLKMQGVSIYPQGLVTGNFAMLTKAAVIRFQKKYGIVQTGFVGILTRTKINQLI